MDAPLASVPVSQCGGDLALWTPLTKVSTIYWTSVMHQILCQTWPDSCGPHNSLRGRFLLSHFTVGGFPGGAMVKSLPANAGDTRDVRSIPGSGRTPGVGNGNPLQYSCLENSMDRGARRAVAHGVAELDTTEWLTMYVGILLWSSERLHLAISTRSWKVYIFQPFIYIQKSCKEVKLLIQVMENIFSHSKHKISTLGKRNINKC